MPLGGLLKKKTSTNRVCPYCLCDLDTKLIEQWCPRCKGKVENGLKKCPSCGSPNIEKMCSWTVDGKKYGCDSRLPKGYTEVPSTLIAVVGAKQVGKTQYLTVLMNYIRKSGFSNEFGISFQSNDDQTATKISDGNDKIREGVTVDVTDTILAGGTAAKPYIYICRNQKGAAESIVIYDTAGEDLKNLDTIQSTKIEAYLRKANGILFLVDPLQIPEIRENLDVGVPLPVSDASHNNSLILERISEVIRTSAKGKIGVNLAVALTKTDLLMKDDFTDSEQKYILDQNMFQPRSRGSVDTASLNPISNSVRSYLNNVGEGQMVRVVENNYSSYHYFITSALGQAPKGDALETEVIPYKVEDPFLWLLLASGSKLVPDVKRR